MLLNKTVLTCFFLFVLCIGCTKADYYTQSGKHSQVKNKAGALTYTGKIMVGTSSSVSGYLHIPSGKGAVKIYSNGKIELVDTDLDEASKEFWQKMEAAYPVFKQTIIDEYVCKKCDNFLTTEECNAESN